jgi:hypothetical protein
MTQMQNIADFLIKYVNKNGLTIRIEKSAFENSRHPRSNFFKNSLAKKCFAPKI